LENDELDLLLFNFLQELVYYKDSELLLLRASQIEFEEKDGKHQLSAVLQGETLDRDRHQQRVDVKAVTLHRFQLEKTNDGWTAMVILDI
jgi:SHS2 domain-containing protein